MATTLEAANVINAVVALGIVISPALPPLGGTTATKMLTVPQPPPVLSVAAKMNVEEVSVMRVFDRSVTALRLSEMAQVEVHEHTVTENYDEVRHATLAYLARHIVIVRV